MIISRLNGGLGNQLFQYAAAKALAEKNNAELYFDLSILEMERHATTKRAFALSPFSINARIADAKLVNTIEKRSTINRLLLKCRLTKTNIYREPHYHFDPLFLKINGNVIINGYMQSSKYFGEVSDQIRKDLVIASPLSAATIAIEKQEKTTTSVSVHVRRGDYITNSLTNNQHGVCDAGYYKKAISIIAAQVNELQLFVFSDDMDWVKANFESVFPITFVDHNDEAHAYEDLYLMSHCKHNIIANSSFSWWAAWLNNNPGKMVIAPAKWFNSSTADTKDLLPEQWIKI